VYAKAIKPSIKILAVEPEGKNLSDCIRTSTRNIDNIIPCFLDTKAEGIKTKLCGDLPFPVLSELIEPYDVFTVTDEEMIQWTKFCFSRMKMVVELAGGAAIAAVMSKKMKVQYPDLKNIGVLLCGGNIDIENLPWI
jgi:serine racemase